MRNDTFLKVSKYTFSICEQGRWYLYNTISNALLEIDEELYTFIKKCKEINQPVETLLEQDLLAQLKESRFITENDDDEFLLIKSAIISSRQENQCVMLTIAPALDCNFSCPYCFESKQNISLTTYSIDIIAKFINRITENKKNSISLGSAVSLLWQ